ncbi:MAG: aminotransferase class V-fold PLP-dependent enzyme [Acidiferrobacterales bacterium]
MNGADKLLASEFPIEHGLIYLNHAAIAPWPQRTADAVNRFAHECLTAGSRHYTSWLDTETELRQRVADLINAPSADNIAFLKNTSEGLSVVAHGFPWKPGDNVVISDEEFPSNRMVWQSLERYNVEVRQVSLGSDKSPEDALLNAVDTRTRILSISAVQYASGLRMDLHRLGEECRKRGIALCVDAIQAVGAIRQDIQEAHIDFLIADAHKWMLAPEGIAVFYCSDAWREQLVLHQYGWHMIEDQFNFEPHVWAPAKSARRFECGSNNMMGIHALNASLSLFQEIGMDEVEKKVLANANHIIDLVQQRQELELITDSSPGRVAGIVTFRHRQKPADVVFDNLQKKGVMCALRGGGIRFSPHCYNARHMLETAIDIAATS